MIKLCYLKYCISKPIFIFLIPLVAIGVIIIMRRCFLKFRNDFEKLEFLKKTKFLRRFITFTRVLIFSSLLIALSTPYSEKVVITEGEPYLKILVDNSTSFNLFDKQIAIELKNKLEKRLPVTLKYIAYGERSAIGDALLANIEEDDNLLVITDGNNNYGRVLGDVIMFARSLNATVSSLNLNPIYADASVIIEGPQKVIAGEKSQFTVIIKTTGDLPPYSLEVKVDDEIIINEKNARTKTFTRIFSPGYHKIVARLRISDYFPQNNIYYKTVKAIEKPKILFVTQKDSDLFLALQQIYDITKVSELPEDLKPYYAIILNDIKGDVFKNWIDRLTNFVVEGNGLVVIGGENSYDRGYYQNPKYLIETILPVKIGKAKKTEKEIANIVVLIDISGTAGQKFGGTTTNSKLDVEKALTLKILEDLRLQDRIAVVAFNDRSHLVSPLSTLGEKVDLIEKIKTLRSGGGTLIFQGLRRAEFLLTGMDGSKNIIAITDGIDAAPDTALKLAKTLKKEGIRIFTVGIGEGTNAEFLRKLADVGNGLYFEPSETQHIKLLFGEEVKEEEKTGLIILDKNHWITKGNLTLRAIISGFNYVTPKPNARIIVTSYKGDPILTVAMFGLGRVVALTTDDGTKWAGSLYEEKNSKLIIRAINWAIGDPSRKEKFDVNIKDTNVGELTEVSVISTTPPKVNGLTFSKIGKNLYLATFMENRTGFHSLLNSIYAVNYNLEYKDLGMNPNLKEVVKLTNGKMFNPKDIDDIITTIKTFSKRVKLKKVDYKWYFIMASTIIFLIEIGTRRIKENKRRVL